MSAIMTAAHSIRKRENVTLSAALRKAWALEKLLARITPLREELSNKLYGYDRWGPTLHPVAVKRAELHRLVAQYNQTWEAQAA